MDEALTMREAAAMLHVTIGDLRDLTDSGEIVGFLLNGRYCIARDEIAKYIRAHKTDTQGRRTIMEAK